jgi:DNA mismatch endonuclease, patch repair protein
MTDTLSPQDRSERMSLIRSKNSKPELFVRRLIHSLGFRYRLHGRDLPGSPDLVFPSRNAVIFVHGCFWHQHRNCKHARAPKSRLSYWSPKLAGNQERDCRNRKALRLAGWRVLVIWECQLNQPNLKRRIVHFLE